MKPPAWLIAACALVAFMLAVHILFTSHGAGEKLVFITMVDVLPGIGESGEPGATATDHAEAGVRSGEVYRGLGRIGPTMTIDDFAVGLTALLDQESLTPDRASIARMRNEIQRVTGMRAELVECSRRLVAIDRDLHDIQEQCLGLLTEQERYLFLERLRGEPR
ncbi:hypothetical protein JW905_05680 [bacterium]|nr:hypothetical protein [candidate division CSSED10-310 bacterium]